MTAARELQLAVLKYVGLPGVYLQMHEVSGLMPQLVAALDMLKCCRNRELMISDLAGAYLNDFLLAKAGLTNATEQWIRNASLIT